MKKAAKDPDTPVVKLNRRGKPRQRAIGEKGFDPEALPDTISHALSIRRFKIGRPRRFQSPQDFLDQAQNFINSCYDDSGKLVYPITITGMCNYLGTTRDRLLEYENGSLVSLMGDIGDAEGFRWAIKRVIHVCHEFAESHGFQARNPAFAIFCLKNYGWSDSIKIEHNVSIEHSISPETRGILESYMTHLRSSLMSDEEDVEEDVIDVEPLDLLPAP